MATEVTLQTILSDIGTILNSVVTWATSILTTITNSPLLFVLCMLPVGLIAIGVIRRLIKL